MNQNSVFRQLVPFDMLSHIFILRSLLKSLTLNSLSTAYGKRSCAAAAEFWISILVSLKQGESINSFKAQLKTYLFHIEL